MAEKRMFSSKIVLSDAFLEMPLSAQCLYFHLNMQADDEGFLNSPKKVMKIVGSNDDDLKILVAKSFVLLFESGVIVIKHWRINNYLRKDRTSKTLCLDERNLVSVKENGAYTFDKNQSKMFGSTNVNQPHNHCPPRLDKISKTYVHFVHDSSLDIDELPNENKNLLRKENHANVENPGNQDIEEILNFLNTKKGSSFRLVDSSTKHIKARLKDGYTKEQCLEVINLKIHEWLDNPKMKKYLRPKTLFAKENFENYVQELIPDKAVVSCGSEETVVYDLITGKQVNL